MPLVAHDPEEAGVMRVACMLWGAWMWVVTSSWFGESQTSERSTQRFHVCTAGSFESYGVQGYLTPEGHAPLPTKLCRFSKQHHLSAAPSPTCFPRRFGCSEASLFRADDSQHIVSGSARRPPQPVPTKALNCKSPKQ